MCSKDQVKLRLWGVEGFGDTRAERQYLPFSWGLPEPDCVCEPQAKTQPVRMVGSQSLIHSQPLSGTSLQTSLKGGLWQTGIRELDSRGAAPPRGWCCDSSWVARVEGNFSGMGKPKTLLLLFLAGPLTSSSILNSRASFHPIRQASLFPARAQVLPISTCSKGR